MNTATPRRHSPRKVHFFEALGRLTDLTITSLRDSDAVRDSDSDSDSDESVCFVVVVDVVDATMRESLCADANGSAWRATEAPRGVETHR